MRGRVVERLIYLCCMGGVACGAPTDAELAELSMPLSTAECTLGAACDDWGPLIEEDSVAVTACDADTAPASPMVWYQAVPDIPCPFGTCLANDAQLSVDADGSLVTLRTLQLPSQHGSGAEGGLYFMRHARDGRPLSTGLWDFSVPPPGLELERHGALLRDPNGRTLFVSSRALLPFDAARPLRASLLSRRGELAPTLPVFLSAPAWGVRAALGAGGEWAVASQHRAGQVSVTRYNQRGRAQWTRSWPEPSRVDAIALDGAQAIFALLTERASDSCTLYKLDARGNVVWRRLLGASHEPMQLVVAKSGASYVAQISSSDFLADVSIHKLSPSGRSLAAWKIPELFFPLPALALDEADQGVVALPGFSGDFLPTVDWYTLAEDGICQRISYAVPTAISTLPERAVVQSDARGGRFFATATSIGQLRKGSQP